MHLSNEEMRIERDETARVEDKVKKTRQKLGGRYVDAKIFTGPFPLQGPKGTQGCCKAPQRGFEDIPFVQCPRQAFTRPSAVTSYEYFVLGVTLVINILTQIECSISRGFAATCFAKILCILEK